MDEQKKQRGGWFRRKARDNDVGTAPTSPQPANSGRFAQWLSAWQERMDNANRRRDLATRLNQDLMGILATCAEQEKLLNQRNMRTQVQLSMSLGRLAGIVQQLETTRAVCAYLIEATQPHLPVVAGVNSVNGHGVNGNGNGSQAAMLAAPSAPSRPLIAGGNPSGPLAAPVVRDLGRGGFKRMARDLQRAYRETALATQEILRPIQTQALHLPEANTLANALAALEPLMTWLNQQCEGLTATYCNAPADQSASNPPGKRSDFWQ